MPRTDLTDITLVVDRSGSMALMRADAQGGIDTFIEEQKAAEGDAVLTLVEFDTEYDVVHDGVAIGEVGAYRLLPRGGTALLDAVGKSLAVAKERIKAMAKDERPGLVVFVIVTDGQENSSREYTLGVVRKSIAARRKKGWEFVFLGKDDSAFDDARSMGISAASTLATGGKLPDVTSRGLTAARGALATDGELPGDAFKYSDAERAEALPEDPTPGKGAS